MDKKERQFFATQLQENPLLQLIIAQMHESALGRALAAKPSEHDIRQAACADMNAIKKFKSHCETEVRNTGSESIKVD